MSIDHDDCIAARGGDHAAFGRLVDRYQPEVRACIAVRLDAAHEVDDLAQEVFLVAYRRLGDFDGEHPFGAWLRGIALNLLRNHYRRRREYAIGAGPELEDLITSPDNERADSGDLVLALESCLERLDDRERRLITLRYRDEASVREIGDHLALAHSAVTMALHRVRERLRLCLERGGHHVSR